MGASTVSSQRLGSTARKASNSSARRRRVAANLSALCTFNRARSSVVRENIRLHASWWGESSAIPSGVIAITRRITRSAPGWCCTLRRMRSRSCRPSFTSSMGVPSPAQAGPNKMASVSSASKVRTAATCLARASSLSGSGSVPRLAATARAAFIFPPREATSLLSSALAQRLRGGVEFGRLWPRRRGVGRDLGCPRFLGIEELCSTADNSGDSLFRRIW